MSYEHEINSNEQVVNKERGKEKGISPYNPLKEKESQKEILPYPSPYPYITRAHVRAQESPTQGGTGTGAVGLRQYSGTGKGGIKLVTSETILDGRREDGTRNDPIVVALAALRLPQCAEYPDGRRYNNARIFRWYLNIIGEECFRDLVHQQWRENTIDGDPRNRAAAFMAKLWNAKNAMLKGAE